MPDTPFVVNRYFASPQPEWADRLYLWLRRRSYSDEAAVVVVRYALAFGHFAGCREIDGDDLEGAHGFVPSSREAAHAAQNHV
jgi:Mg-chelatase subunit ChlI